MLQQFIQRHLRPSVDRADAAPEPAAVKQVRPADWLLGGSVATLAVVFVAGLLGLRASTADLQDQSRNNSRDLAALKADTLERIEGISGTLAKTNQTLTDLLALRSAAPAAKGRSAVAGDAAGRDDEGGADAKAVRPTLPRVAPVAAKPVLKPTTRTPARTAGKSAGKPEPVRLSTITVRRRPERERTARRPEPAPRPVAAARPDPRTAVEAQKARREAILRELRQRRLARRGYGPL